MPLNEFASTHWNGCTSSTSASSCIEDVTESDLSGTEIATTHSLFYVSDKQPDQPSASPRVRTKTARFHVTAGASHFRTMSPRGTGQTTVDSSTAGYFPQGQATSTHLRGSVVRQHGAPAVVSTSQRSNTPLGPGGAPWPQWTDLPAVGSKHPARTARSPPVEEQSVTPSVSEVSQSTTSTTPDHQLRSTPTEHLLLERDALHNKLNSISVTHAAEMERKEAEARKVLAYWKNKYIHEQAIVEELQQHLHDLELAHSEHKETEARRTDQLCAVMKEKKLLMKNVDELEQQLAFTDTELKQARVLLEQANEHNEDLATKLNGFQTTSQEVEDRDVVRRDQIRLLEQQLRTLKADLEEQNKTVLKLKDDKEQVEEQLAILQTSKEETSALQNQNDALKGKMNKLKADLQAAKLEKSTAVQDMQKTLDSMLENISYLNNENTSREAEVHHNKLERDHIAEELTKYVKQCNEMQSVLNKERSMRSELEVLFEKTVTDLSAQLEAEARLRNNVEIQLSNAQTALAQRSTANVDINTQLSVTAQENQLLKEQYSVQADLLNERQQLSLLISQMETKFSHAMEEIKAAQVFGFGKEIKSMDERLNQLTELQEQLRVKDRELQQTKEELERLEAHVNAVSKMFVKFPMSIDELEWIILELEELKKVAAGPNVEARVRARKAALHANSGNLGNPTGSPTDQHQQHSQPPADDLGSSPVNNITGPSPFNMFTPSNNAAQQPPDLTTAVKWYENAIQQQAKLDTTLDTAARSQQDSTSNSAEQK